MKGLAQKFLAAFTLLIGGFTPSAFAQTDSPNSDHLRYEQSIQEYFGRSPFYAIPIFLSGQRESGDTLTIGVYNRYSPRELCFPSLGRPTLANSTLSRQEEVDGFALAGAGHIALKKIVSAAANAKYDHISNYTLAFTNVQVDETALYVLKTKGDYNACPFMRYVVEGKVTKDNIVLANMVVRGQEEFSIILKKQMGGGANVGTFKGWLNKIFGGAKIEAKVDNKTYSLFSITNTKIVPVAFRPAFVSLDDVLMREKEIKTGLEKQLDEIWKKKDVKAGKSFLEKHKELAIPPDKIYENMLRAAKLTEFVKENPRYQRYMNMVTSHILVSSLVFGQLGPR